MHHPIQMKPADSENRNGEYEKKLFTHYEDGKSFYLPLIEGKSLASKVLIMHHRDQMHRCLLLIDSRTESENRNHRWGKHEWWLHGFISSPDDAPTTAIDEMSSMCY